MSSLAPEDNLLLLCMHGAKHCWSRLERVCDVAELITSHSNLDWVALVSRAKVFGADSECFISDCIWQWICWALSYPLRSMRTLRSLRWRGNLGNGPFVDDVKEIDGAA